MERPLSEFYNHPDCNYGALMKSDPRRPLQPSVPVRHIRSSYAIWSGTMDKYGAGKHMAQPMVATMAPSPAMGVFILQGVQTGNVCLPGLCQ